MRQSSPNVPPPGRVNRAPLPGFLFCAALLTCGASGGCAALTNPVADGVPVRRLPPELLAPPRNGEQTIPLTLLSQPHPAEYRLAPGDILGVYVEGFLGDRTQPLPVHVGPRFQQGEEHRLASALGYPVAVQEDGAVTLPPVGAVSVNGMTVPQAAAAMRKVYTDKQLLKPETDRILVNLLDPRQEQILVLREESPNLIVGPEGVISGAKRGTGHEIDLPAYENDVLHALTRTGGLPGLDAFNAVVIYRNCFEDDAARTALRQQFETRPQACDLAASGRCVQTIRIPLRTLPGVAPPFRPEDVILHTGDVVLLECRDTQVFYTAGLLPPAVHVLPRDYDLDVIAAISQSRGPLVNGGFAVSNLSGALLAPGVGGPSPSLLTVLRRTPGGGQVPITVNLNRALRDSRENIVVQAGDVLILQEQPGEALARYFTQSLFNFNVVWEAFHSPFGGGVIDLAAPDRLPQRLGVNGLQPQ